MQSELRPRAAPRGLPAPGTVERAARGPHVLPAPLQHSLQLSTLPFSRRSELIGKISADAGLMGNDHILPLRTEDGLVQRRAPALGQHIYAVLSH